MDPRFTFDTEVVSTSFKPAIARRVSCFSRAPLTHTLCSCRFQRCCIDVICLTQVRKLDGRAAAWFAAEKGAPGTIMSMLIGRGKHTHARFDKGTRDISLCGCMTPRQLLDPAIQRLRVLQGVDLTVTERRSARLPLLTDAGCVFNLSGVQRWANRRPTMCRILTH